MRIHFYKYQGAGNDFVVFDGTTNGLNLSSVQVQRLCNRHFGIGADGVLVLRKTPLADFEMQFFNPDGTSGMFCGNGGRCISMFAKHKGIVTNDVLSFLASDGIHFARIIDAKTVSLKMSNCSNYKIYKDGIWIDTGTSHFVTFVDDIDKTDVAKQGRKLRNDKRFESHNGANANFVKILDKNELAVRTYERGVEYETLACGTGITASALAYSIKEESENGKHNIKIHTLCDDLSVEFNKTNSQFDSVLLTGHAERVFDGEIIL